MQPLLHQAAKMQTNVITVKAVRPLEVPAIAPSSVAHSGPALTFDWGETGEIRTQIESTVCEIDPDVAGEISSLLKQDRVLDAKERLIAYVISEDHGYQIRAAAAAKRNAFLRDHTGFCNSMTRMVLGSISSLASCLLVWIMFTPAAASPWDGYRIVTIRQMLTAKGSKSNRRVFKRVEPRKTTSNASFDRSASGPSSKASDPSFTLVLKAPEAASSKPIWGESQTALFSGEANPTLSTIPGVLRQQ